MLGDSILGGIQKGKIELITQKGNYLQMDIHLFLYLYIFNYFLTFDAMKVCVHIHTLMWYQEGRGSDVMKLLDTIKVYTRCWYQRGRNSL